MLMYRFQRAFSLKNICFSYSYSMKWYSYSYSIRLQSDRVRVPAAPEYEYEYEYEKTEILKRLKLDALCCRSQHNKYIQ